MQLCPQIGFSIAITMNQVFAFAYGQFVGILNGRHQIAEDRNVIAINPN